MSTRFFQTLIITIGTGLLVGGVATGAAAQAAIVVEDTQMVLGPTPDGGAIVVDTRVRFVFTPSAQRVVPQGGPWVLDWPGSANLPAGHYEGSWSANARLESLAFDENGIPHLVVPAKIHFVMPAGGVVSAHAVNYQTGLCGVTPTFTQEWRYSRLLGTGVFSGLTDLSGTAVATIVRECAPVLTARER